ncbi:MAG TPA: DUF3267 domain-containing protein [Anaerolineales bacterium]|nr:DUF3267 domain-containing protein [Anaerolineales bacterium]
MNKRDLSVSMERANIIVLFIGIPVVILQFILFDQLHPSPAETGEWNFLLLLLVIVMGVILHEIVHGVTWAIAGRKPWTSIKFGVQAKTLTPYCHITEPLEINAYRIGAVMPGLVVGVLPYIYSLMSGNMNWLWFSLVHTSAAGGDWLVLWLIRHVKAGSLVEDHPSQAGCYVLEG